MRMRYEATKEQMEDVRSKWEADFNELEATKAQLEASDKSVNQHSAESSTLSQQVRNQRKPFQNNPVVRK